MVICPFQASSDGTAVSEVMSTTSVNMITVSASRSRPALAESASAS